MKYDKSQIYSSLKHVQATEGDQNLIDAGHVRNIQVFGDEVEVDVISMNPTLQAKKKLEVNILKAVHEHAYPKAKIKVNVIVPEEAKQKAAAQQQIRGEELPGVKNIIAVASGKGGVGKSTLTANLAVSLAKMGFKVGLVDADIYGPSMPIMFDVVNERPSSIEVNGKKLMDPVEAHGVKMLSIGFFAGTDQAVVWRGPMATKALNQMIRDSHWGDLDFMLIDLPPGTGDIHLSLVQAVPVTGAVIVSTPQAIALSDARKGVAMFGMDSINVPVLGIVENMSYFSPEELPDNKYYIFGKSGAKNLTEELKVPFLGEVPLVQSVREAGDVGRPAVMQENTPIAETLKKVAQNMVESLVERNENLPPTEAVRITTMAGCSPKKEKTV
ncbi:Mrp/NBP35 family ATP-binding protein [Phaeocystidibacter luteus]|uniref:Iron-sulfur cluster carrier protein n=1 Tax=Phaeocystidibacter luteus TaxID=911197 RepID=A0A6N6RIC7_9FLAO|nr:Mrp/NBP35 family ATP-binding protein [Phaeocystidibacter luteus]KAB2813717.1 Mrp/NBP35 family ATP-binding protein [Phaeocystidibacter luteus]